MLTVLLLSILGEAPAAAQERVDVCVYENHPLLFIDADHRPQGLFIDILEAVADQENWTLNYSIGSWQECLDSLNQAAVDLLPGIAYSAERAERYRFNRETVVTNYGVVYVGKNAGIHSILDLQDKSVGVLRGDIHYKAFKRLTAQFGVGCNFIEVPTYEALETLFQQKTIQAGLFNRLNSIKRKLGASIVQSPIVLNPIEIRFATLSGNTKYLDAIDHHLTRMKTDRASVYRTAMDRWLVLSPSTAVPQWLYWSMGAACLFVLIAALFNFFLRRQIRSKTEALKQHYNQLDIAIQTRQEAEKRLQAVIDNTPIIVWAIDAKGVLSFAQGKGLEPLALTGEEAAGQSLFDIFSANAKAIEITRKVLDGISSETIVKIEDRFFDVRYEPDWNAKGEVIGAIGIGIDVTEQARAQKKLRDSESLFRTAFRTHPDSININRLNDGVYIDINEGFTQLTGYTREEVIGRSSMDINIWHDPEDRNALVRGLTEYGRVNNLEACFRLKDGQVKTGLMSAAVIQLHGEPHILSVTRNIEDRKQVEQKLRESEERFRLAFDHAAIGRGIASPDGPFIQVNRSFASILGMTREELLTKRWQDITHPDFLETVNLLVEKLVRDELPVMTLELKMRHKDGHDVWTRLNCVLARNDSGVPLYLVGDIEDITSRYAYEQRLRKYKRIVGTSKDQMSLVNRNYVYEAVNSSYLKSHGLGRDEIVGRTVADVNGENVFRKTIKPHLDKAFSGQMVNYQSRFNLDGTGKRYMDVSYFPYTEEDGQTTGVVVHVRDITETKRMEQRLTQSQKMEAIGSLAGGIAHDFNNILSPILGYAELLLEALPDQSEAHENVARIYSAGKRARNLVRQILTFSRSAETEIKPIKVQPILKEVLELVRSSIPSTIDIEHTLDPDCAMVMADPTQIHQVAMNLITNAYHALRATGGKITIRLANHWIESDKPSNLSLPPGKYLRLTMADNGCGMDPERLSKIFDPYFTTKERGEGTGLGLSVVHGIIKKIGGEIEVASEVGVGSTFCVYLPAIADAPSIRPMEEKTTPDAGNAHILIVDDEVMLVELQQTMLERMGYRTTTRTSSLEALETFKDAPQTYDLVITDMTMPQMTGLALAKALKHIRPEVKVILCTGYSEQIDHETDNHNHIDGFIMKPVVMSELSAVLTNILQT